MAGRVHQVSATEQDVTEQLRTVEMVADLLAASPCTRNRVRWRNILRIDSLVAFCRTENVSLIRALAEPTEIEQRRSWYVHHRVPSSAVERALQVLFSQPLPRLCR